MKKFIVLILTFLVLTSCNKTLNDGIDWEPGADEEQYTKEGLKVELQWYGDSIYMVANVSDKMGRTLAYISWQKDDDICTVVKYLYNDSGGVRGFLVYPNCYPMADRRDKAILKEMQTDELQNYKKMLWSEFSKRNHPCSIGLALALDDREDRPCAARYYFKYDEDEISEVYDPILNLKIEAELVGIKYDVRQQTKYLEDETIIGDVQLLFTDECGYDESLLVYKTYLGYRPLEKLEIWYDRISEHTIFRSDRPEPFVTMLCEESDNSDSTRRYVLTCDFDDKKLVSTYVDGILQKVEQVSEWGTVLKQDLFFESLDKKAYICFFKNYNYQTKHLIKVGEERILKPDFYMMYDEDEEMQLDGYLHIMWGRFGIDSYWDVRRYLYTDE